MKKKILTIAVCVMIAFCFSGTTSAYKNNEITEKNEKNIIASYPDIKDRYGMSYIDKENTDQPFLKDDYEWRCDYLGNRYHVSPEMIQAIQENVPSVILEYSTISHLAYLYEQYEDNYIVLNIYIREESNNTCKLLKESYDEEINTILDRALELEKEHGKV